jgi:hypothetical protein
VLTGEATIEGAWFDRTAEQCARLRGEKVGPRQFVQPETVQSSPLSCWKQLTLEAYRNRVTEMVRVIEQQARKQCEVFRNAPLGAKACFPLSCTRFYA